MEAWYPSSDDEFGIFLEDDIEVSPYFFKWTLLTLHEYVTKPNSIQIPRGAKRIYVRPFLHFRLWITRVTRTTSYFAPHSLPSSVSATIHLGSTKYIIHSYHGHQIRHYHRIQVISYFNFHAAGDPSSSRTSLHSHTFLLILLLTLYCE